MMGGVERQGASPEAAWSSLADPVCPSVGDSAAPDLGSASLGPLSMASTGSAGLGYWSSSSAQRLTVTTCGGGILRPLRQCSMRAFLEPLMLMSPCSGPWKVPSPLGLVTFWSRPCWKPVLLLPASAAAALTSLLARPGQGVAKWGLATVEASSEEFAGKTCSSSRLPLWHTHPLCLPDVGCVQLVYLPG